MSARTVAMALAVIVALVSGYVSYLHIVAVAMAVGERPEVAYALPITIDALMVMSTLVLLSDRSNRWAQSGFLFGVAVSVACNIASAEPSLAARGVAAIPAVTLLLAVELLVRPGRPVKVEPEAVSPETATLPFPGKPARPARKVAVRRTGRRRGEATKAALAAIAEQPNASVAELARVAGVSRATVRRVNNGHKVVT